MSRPWRRAPAASSAVSLFGPYLDRRLPLDPNLRFGFLSNSVCCPVSSSGFCMASSAVLSSVMCSTLFRLMFSYALRLMFGLLFSPSFGLMLSPFLSLVFCLERRPFLFSCMRSFLPQSFRLLHVYWPGKSFVSAISLINTLSSFSIMAISPSSY